ncbi:hypothetical protein BJV78DRAFT_1287019 [Lactifluus subvellereus]|nr:hypothetical protein BJV78DRAFT_1287019 [Lactifluus subvellereus]
MKFLDRSILGAEALTVLEKHRNLYNRAYKKPAGASLKIFQNRKSRILGLELEGRPEALGRFHVVERPEIKYLCICKVSQHQLNNTSIRRSAQILLANYFNGFRRRIFDEAFNSTLTASSGTRIMRRTPSDQGKIGLGSGEKLVLIRVHFTEAGCGHNNVLTVFGGGKSALERSEDQHTIRERRYGKYGKTTSQSEDIKA